MNNNSDRLIKPCLSFCAIVKNELVNLPRCLASVKPYVSEMIVVDTGSEDETPKVAAEHGAKITSFEWCDDFSAARNYALSQVSGDWILMLDADEELVVISEDFLNKLTCQSEIIAYSLILTDVNDQESMTPLHTRRLFRNLPDLKYVGRYHEQLIYKEQPISGNLTQALSDIRILHYGYNKKQLQQKNLNRNIPILERIRQEEGLSLMLLYCLAGMYDSTQQAEKAQECYAEAFDRLLPNLIDSTRPEEFSFVPSLIYALGIKFLMQKDYETARLLCQHGIEWYPHYPPLNYLAGFILIALGFPLGAVIYLKNCLQLGREENYYKEEPFELSFITTDPACALGNVYIHLKRWQEAVTAFELALSFDQNCTLAKQNLDKIKQLQGVQS